MITALHSEGRRTPSESAQHEFVIEQALRQRLHKQRVHVGIDTAGFEQDVEPDEIGLVRIEPSGLADDSRFRRFVAGTQDRSLGRLADAMQRQARPDSVPPSPMRLVPVVEVNAVGAIDLPAGFEAKIVRDVQGLGLRTQAEHEMIFVRDLSHRSRPACNVRSPARQIR
jgi:hypothetical protein